MRKFLLLLFIALGYSFIASAQDFSNKGKDFYLCFPSHVPNSNAGAPILSIYITSDKASTGTVKMINGAFSATFNLNAGNNFFQEIQILSATGQITNAESNAISKKAIRVTTDAGKPAVVVYAQQWAGARSAATLILPTNVLGKKYYAVSETQALPGQNGSSGTFLSKSHFQIIAIKDNTVVQVTPKFNGVAQPPFTINLPLAGDMYQYEPASSSDDITGTYIESQASGSGGCLPIAVFSGTSGIALGAAPCGTSPNSSDPLFQQLYPISTWGKNYGFIPFTRYTGFGNPYRILAAEDNTNVYFDGVLVATLMAGELYPNTYSASPPTLKSPTSITSDKPISVTQFLQSNACAGTAGTGTLGDPDMVVLNPIEQNISDITVFSSSNQAISEKYVNVLIKTIATPSFKINGAAPTGTWQTFTTLPGYSYLQGQVFPTAGSYHLTADSGFNAIAYGFGANESYAYSAGTNVKDLSKHLGISSVYGQDPNDPSICTGSPFEFKVYFPAKYADGTPIVIDSMDWNSSNNAVLVPNNFPKRIIAPPVDSTTIVGGVQVNWYHLPGLYNITTAGSYTITITNYTAGSDACGNSQENDFQLDVFDPPLSSFSVTKGGCYTEPYSFKETTPQIPKPTYSWWWDFGDPASGANNTSNQRNPTHTFSGPSPAGGYRVRFAGITTPGCLSDTTEQFIVVPDLPKATIATSTATTCINTLPAPVITFTGTDGTAEYYFDYKINGGATVTTAKSVGGVVTINVPTNVAGTFHYDVVAVRNASPAATTCERIYPVNTIFTDVTITPDATITLDVAGGSGPASPTVCINNAITDIKYKVGGSGTSANLVFTASPLPGVTGSYNGATNTFTITGTPTAAGVYPYEVQTVGPCVTPKLTGTITVNDDAAINLFSGPATQTVCVNNPITQVVYDITRGGTNATVTFTPALPGVTGTYNAVSKKLTIQGTPNPVITVPTTYNYTVTATGPCLSATATGSVTVNPDHTLTLTSAAATTNQTVCENVAIADITYNVAGGANNASVTFLPSLPAGITGVYNAATNEFKISGTPTGITTNTTYTYTVTTTGNACIVATKTGSITINADAAISLSSGTATQTVCVNKPIAPVVYDITEGGNNATITFTPALPGVTGTYNAVSKKFTISGTPNPAITVATTYNYTITATGLCLSATATGSITVEPDHTLTLTSAVPTTNQTVCENVAIADITYTVAGGGNNATVTFVPPAPAGITGVYNAATNEFKISGTPTGTTTNTTYNYTVTTTGNSCNFATKTGSITVNSDAAIGLFSGPATQTVCVNTPITPVVFDVTEGGTNATVTFTPALPGVTGTYNAAAKKFTINGTPNPVITVPTTYNFTVTATGLCLPSSTGGTGSITVNPDHTLTLTSAAATTNQTVCENVAITDITYNVAGGANNASITFTPSIPAGITGVYNAATNEFRISGTPTGVTATTTFNYTVTTSGNSCLLATKTGSITVKADGDISLFSGTTTQEVCRNVAISPIVFNITGGATGASISPALPTGITGTYSAGQFTIQGTPTTAPSSQVYTITTTGSTCVENSATINLTINQLPTPSFTVSTPNCESQSITFTSTSVANSGVINFYDWDFGDATAHGSNPVETHTYATPGVYTVTLNVRTDKSCNNAAPATQTFTVYANPVADFTVPEACLSDMVQFNDISTFPAGSSITGWNWDFGDPASGANNTSIAQNGQHQFTTTGNFTVKLTVTTVNGCKHFITHNIFINGSPVADYSVANAGALCSSDTVRITNLSTVVPVGTVTKVEICWDNVGAPGVIVTDNAPVAGGIYKHKYPTLQTTKTYDVRFRAYSGNTCLDDEIKTITVNATPKVQLLPFPDACWDAAPYALTQGSDIGGVPGNGVYTGPGITGTNTFNPALAGIGKHRIKYTYTANVAGCLDSLSADIIVRDTATANFSFTPACDGDPVAFKDESTAPTGINLSTVTWDFGDLSAPQTVAAGSTTNHVFPGPGIYNVKLYNTTDYGCKSTVRSQAVKVNYQPVPAFSFVESSVCLPNAVVHFTNTSSIADPDPLVTLSYSWDFGDGSAASTAFQPAHTYTGVGPYTVTLTVKSSANCVKTISHVVNFIHPQPHAAYTTNKPSVCIADDVVFTDVTNPLDGTTVAWHWDLGDGSIRTTNSFTYTYTNTDSFYVKMYITNSQGCNSDTTNQLFAVYPYPTVDAGPDKTILEGGSVKFQPIVTGQGLTYLWTPDLYFNHNNRVKEALAIQVMQDVTYTLTVTALGGCSLSDKVFVKVLKFPAIPNTFTPNNDGINDLWVIQYLNTYPDNRVQVFSKTGQLVFESHGYSKPWDGTKNGKPLPIDTYYYVIEPGNGRDPITGYVTILK